MIKVTFHIGINKKKIGYKKTSQSQVILMFCIYCSDILISDIYRERKKKNNFTTKVQQNIFKFHLHLPWYWSIFIQIMLKKLKVINKQNKFSN